ncbi:hypothetical protein C8A00DRAFT_45679 [Chaetomidium leptoderma]|uniref:Uncharacterized protein n=1 Tax=Chaetomidium leptoderma TaxID=669021 RepID=A0AAN6VH79_9PEZI|nr:hypothetical protein C8A00DRAFT_45679 [Chaetomidium leptoderma]
MAAPATDPSDLPGSPGDDEHHFELVSLDVSTIEEIIDHIVSARQRDSSHSESMTVFHWQASQAYDLSNRLDARLVELDEPKIRRFQYNYESETVYLDIRGESEFQYRVQAGLRDYINNQLAELLATTDDPPIRQLIRSINESGTFLEKYDGKLCKQADVSFGLVGPLPSLVCEAHQYLDSSDGQIRAVLILHLQYPSMKKAWVSLLAADGSSRDQDLHFGLYHDDDLDQQPVGQVELYLSDFLGLAVLPAYLCRPSTDELAVGITRDPAITLTYKRLGAIFRRARSLHNPTEFTTEIGDEDENLSEEAKRRVAEVRLEADRRMAEVRLEADHRMAEVRLEADRRVAEAERRVTEMRQCLSSTLLVRC